ncbi:hypothetical protein MKY91_20565 [Alkalicoccobacillus gibsonii]|uniref:ParB/Sulfiredoxin domain-containing protein n=1 Tax=Alkalicoccobacillus gibsonii TaxID=79881 RepID=A0ABU9VNT9_9BACI
MEEFDPRNHSYAFRLTEKSCFALANNGICSLKLSSTDAQRIRKNERVDPKASVMYCRELKDEIEDSDYLNKAFPIEIIKNNCEHHSFMNGQHRTCIAKQTGMKTLNVIYQVADYQCPYCLGTHANVIIDDKELYKAGGN